jgi:hypothetical protein
MPVDAGIAIVGAGVAIYGAVKKNQAAKAAQNNLANRPQYNSLPEDDSELNLAEAQANQGMGAGARQALQNNTDRNLATLSNATLMGGGDANTLAGIADKTQSAYNNNAIYDDQARQQHLGTLLSTYAGYNAQRQGNADKSFQFNKYAPWADQQQLYSNQIAGGQQTMNSGFNLFAKGAAGAAQGWGDDNNQTNPGVLSGSRPGPVSQPYGASSMGGDNPGEYTPGEGSFNFQNSGNGGGGNYNWNGMTPYYTSAA